MSRWMIFSEWRYFKPLVASQIHLRILNSEKFFLLIRACVICPLKSPFLKVQVVSSNKDNRENVQLFT